MGRRRGSSPLARGLQRAAPPRSPPRRIIPARAGFTSGSSGTATTPRDHPRSRGVYSADAWQELFSTGSSPLARGLQRAAPPRSPPRRIIPARAGFTPRGCPAASPAPGSSPLARGLQPGRGRLPRREGIIPARAGFTQLVFAYAPTHWDHPRSRGVYLIDRSVPSECIGSSPLARGLPLLDSVQGRLRRIIPARAGFTRRWITGLPPVEDHPRSRGVYSTGRRFIRLFQGSSPLARGLPYLLGCLKPLIGIIPARAGFTAYGSYEEYGVRDHPRSRGVYGLPCF